MRIILLRHGESEANAKGVGGHEDNELSELGRRQAKKTGEFLKNYNVGHIISSPFKRAKDTAQIVATELKIKDIDISDTLREGSNGIVHSMTDEEVKQIPKIGTKIYDMGMKLRNLDPIETMKISDKYTKLSTKFNELIGGDTDEDMLKRAKEAAKMIKKIKTKKDILVVSHGGAIKAIQQVMFKISMLGGGSNYGKYKNCHITVYNTDTGLLEVQSYSKHLDQL